MRKVIAYILMSLSLCQPLMAQADDIVIAVLGDSLTQGYGLPAEDGLVPQLQRWLDAQRADVVLLNAGVSGDTTAGGLSRVDWTLTPDVDAMIVALGGNDLLRGLAPEDARTNIDGILSAANSKQVEVLLIGMQAPGNFGADYKARFDAVYPELATKHNVLLMQNFFAGLLESAQATDPASLQRWFQADGIHPNAEGVANIVTRIGPEVLALIDTIKE
ncbi:arylesterase [Sulfitobacter sp. SK012]|uniref:arylesterase n=1 Tax=Sulfitobacter sp. SK012 TaxID=1389005 RepID=UPI000E0BA101|nr:arylesterase [Sulfitobacter sp. SK012]AXI48115.1 arylesterase [Sulfitobacter sp. SK012]